MEQLEKEIQKWKKEIISDGYPMSIGEVISMYKEGDLDIHPEFQRMYRWTLKQKSKFIESLLLSMPVPSFFVAQRSDGIWDVVDGLQRLSTILSFVGELKDENGNHTEPLVLDATDYLKSLQGMTWDGDKKPFPDSLKRAFKREKIDFKIIKKESDIDTKYELFQRLNTGGSSLSNQELRNCLMIMLDRDFYEWFEKLSHNEDFMTCIAITDKQIEEKYHMDLLTRFLVLQHVDWNKETELTDVGEYLTDRVRLYINNTRTKDIKLENEKNKFEKTFRLLNNAFSDNSFRKYFSDIKRHKGAFSLALFEGISIGIVKNINIYNIDNLDVLKDKIEKFSSEYNFIKNSGSGVRASSRLPRLIPSAIAYFKK